MGDLRLLMFKLSFQWHLNALQQKTGQSHVIGIEKKICQTDALIDGTIDRFIIHLGGNPETDASNYDSDIGCTPIQL